MSQAVQNRFMTPMRKGVAAAVALAATFGLIIRLFSGSWDGVIIQLQDFGLYLAVLDVGFGVQIWLYAKIREMHAAHGAARGLSAATGTTSAAAMLACCTHYVAAAVPFFGLAGFAGVVTEYQHEILLLGIAANFAGIAYLWRQLQGHSGMHAREANQASGIDNVATIETGK